MNSEAFKNGWCWQYEHQGCVDSCPRNGVDCGRALNEHTAALCDDLRAERNDLQEQLDSVCAELERFKRREPLVRELLTAAANLITQEGCALPIEVQVRDLDEARMGLERFNASEEADGS